MPRLDVSFAARLALPLLATLLPAQGDFLYTVSSVDGDLRVFDLQLGLTVSSVPITSTAGAATQCNGLTRDPTTGALYVLARFPGSSARQLATLDPTTGTAVILGVPGDNFAGLACRIDGTLYGVTGDGAATPETLYTIDKTTGAKTFAMAFGNGNDGETIAFADNTLLFHASGLGIPNVDEVLETVDTFGAGAIVNVPLAGFDYDELLALTSYAGDALVGVDLFDEIVQITTAGQVASLGVLDHTAVKGLVWMLSPPTQGYFRAYGNGCAASGGTIPMLFGSGTPVAGSTVNVYVRLAPASSFLLLAMGGGTGTIPLPSPTCQVQINPVFGNAGVLTTPIGTADFNIGLPTPFPPVDLYFQAGVLDGSSFVVSNPLQMHTR
ncbi:MAG: hypothetical protein KDE27_08130 [Planctomycetes bacterium]|nr:hypothetical protein [Planctomycetota bacterium]